MNQQMLTQAIENLKALECEMRDGLSGDRCKFPINEVQCWADKVTTVLADLTEIQAEEQP